MQLIDRLFDIESVNVELYLPERPNSVADVIGKAIRCGRANLLPIAPLFLLPILIGTICDEGMVWAGQCTLKEGRFGLYAGLFTISAVILFWADWQIAIRKYAACLMLKSSMLSCKQALKQAEARRLMILLLVAPLGLIDLALAAISLWSRGFIESGSGSKLSTFVAFLYLLSIPIYYSLTFVCSWWVAIAALERLSVLSALRRLVSLSLRLPLQFVGATVLFGILCSATIGPYLLVYDLVGAIPHLVGGVLSGIVQILISLVRCAVGGTFNLLTGVLLCVGSAFLHNEFVMRLEGLDIVRRLVSFGSREEES